MTDIYERIAEAFKRFEVADNELKDSIAGLIEVVEETHKESWPLLVGTYLQAKAAYEGLEKTRLPLYHAVELVNKSVIPARFEAEETDGVKIPELGKSVYPVKKLSCSILDQASAKVWLTENGGEDLIKMTINSSSLSAFVNNLIKEEGIDPPEDVIKVNSYTITGVSNYSPKK